MTAVDLNVGDDLAFTYDPRGNLASKIKAGITTHLYDFDVENRLSSVTTGNQTMTFAYDADGQRVMTTRHDGTVVYTPFPDYEIEDPPSGADITRTTYRLAGQIVAVQHKVGTAAGTFYYTYGDLLGNIAGLSYTGGRFLSDSTAWYDPFGTFTTTPGTNPSLTNHGFTGHRYDNMGTLNQVWFHKQPRPFRSSSLLSNLRAIISASTSPEYK